MGSRQLQPGSDLFAVPHSLRLPGESAWLWVDVLLAPLTVGVVGAVLHSPFRISQVGLLVVVAMVYVTLARGRLLGTSVRVHDKQFPELFAVVDRCAGLLGVPVPNVFLREDVIVPITAMGLGEPYAIVISSEWLGHFDGDELEFVIGRELGHIAAGHTRISSLFSASGRENPLVALVFGAWLRRTEYTADRIGLLCCRSVQAAVRAIYVTSFRALKGRVDPTAFNEQRRAIETDPSLEMGEWLSEMPYAVNRVKELDRFAASEGHAYWRRELSTRQRWQPPVRAGAGERIYGSLYLRSLSLIVDAIVVGAIIASGKLVVGLTTSKADLDAAIRQLGTEPDAGQVAHWLATHKALLNPDAGPVLGSVGLVAIMLYSAILVAAVGRTCGMLVFDMRVVRKDSLPVGPLRALWRYFVGFISLVTVVPALVGALTGWWPHERLSGTRLVRGGVQRV
jgi:Zn-dependent protease with chaperone function